MIEVSEADKIIQQAILPLPAVPVPLMKAGGRVLRQNIVADTDFPPFNRVMMDGIAVRFEDVANGIREFQIAGIQAAGAEQMQLQENGTCLEVMTGAVCPANADLIIPYEEVEIDSADQKAKIGENDYVQGKNIHKQGSDNSKGDVLIEPGKVLGAPELAVAASVGLTEIQVSKNPFVAIISTGDELVDIGDKPLPHQIRRSNVYAIQAALQGYGISSSMFHLNDEPKELEEELQKVLDHHDVVLMSGGVSKGKFDYVPETLAKLGVQKQFHRIQQKPGKPLWFGVREDRKVVFAFPGNPVSTFLCFHRYFVPWLERSLGIRSQERQKAVLAEDFDIKTRLTYFLQVALEVDVKGQLLAHPKVGRGSGDHANLIVSDAFLELPANTFRFKQGEVFDVIPFR